MTGDAGVLCTLRADGTLARQGRTYAPERTCRLLPRPGGLLGCSACGWVVRDWDFGNYCAGCGARVLGLGERGEDG